MHEYFRVEQLNFIVEILSWIILVHTFCEFSWVITHSVG